MKKAILALTALLATLVVGCSGTNPSSHRAYGSAEGSTAPRADADDDEAVALDAIPAAVRAAALARLPGFVITAAEKETEDGVLLYSLEGTVNGVRHEIEVSAVGAVLDVETGADDDDDDDEDEDEDDDN